MDWLNGLSNPMLAKLGLVIGLGLLTLLLASLLLRVPSAPSRRKTHATIDYEEFIELILLAYRVEELKNHLRHRTVELHSLCPVIEDVVEYLQIKKIAPPLPQNWSQLLKERLAYVQQRFPVKRQRPTSVEEVTARYFLKDARAMLN